MAGTFQKTLNYDYAFGVVGEIMRDGPSRAHQGYINSASATNNVFGRMFTLNADGKTVGAGGTGALWGLLSNPKQHVSFGTTTDGPLAPSFTLPNNLTADFAELAKIVVQLATASAPGDLVTYKISDGSLDRVAPIAAFTASQATNTLTVTAITAGNIGIGTVVKDPTGVILGTVTALGTGTGGNGTYTLNTSATVASEAMTGNSQAPAGFAFAQATVEDYPQTSANGQALIKINL